MFSLLLFFQGVSCLLAMPGGKAVTKPVVTCISLDMFNYKCEWLSAPNTSYTCQQRINDNMWLSITPNYINDTGKQHVYATTFNPEQVIMVNATKGITHASTTVEFHVYRNLKPNVSCGSPCLQITQTFAKLKWFYRDIVGFDSSSNVAYQMYPDDVEKTEVKHNIEGKTITIYNLKPARKYHFFVQSRYIITYCEECVPNNYSDWTRLVSATTLENRPSDTVQNLSIGHGMITWNEIPEESRNGEILGYTVTLNGSSVDTLFTKHNIKDSYIGYNVCVTAYNSEGHSPGECLIIGHSIMGSTDETTILPTDNRVDKPSTVQLAKNSSSQTTILLIVVTMVLVVIILTIMIYIKLEKKDLFIKWPDPKYPTIRFDRVVHLPPENEVFDDLRQERLTAVPDNITTRENNLHTPSTSNDIADDNSILPVDTDEPSTPPVYHLVGEESKKKLPNTAGSSCCIRVTTEMSTPMPYIVNMIGSLTDNKGHCMGPPKQTEYSVDNRSADTITKTRNEHLLLMHESSPGYMSLSNCPPKNTSTPVANKSDNFIITRAEVIINKNNCTPHV